MTATTAPLTTLAAVQNFILAGRAIFTVVSRKTSDRKTFRVVRAKPRPGDGAREPGWFVGLLTGPQNTTDFHYLGFIFRDGAGVLQFRPNKTGWGVEAVAAFAWILGRVQAQDPRLLEQADVWHEGKCGCCGRPLTVPESIASGIGPVCEQRIP